MGDVTTRVEYLGTSCKKERKGKKKKKNKATREVCKVVAYGSQDKKLEAEDSEHNHLEMARYEPGDVPLTSP